jgi:DNA invertase Pin-like site-specific DNA recombinase
MSLIGYARVSSADQSLEIQLDALRHAGCERIFQEKRSGRTADDRQEWLECMEFLREGDVLVFTRLDRVGRSMVDLANIGRELQDKGVEVRCLLQPIDTTTAEGRLFWGMLAAFAEYDVDLKRARQKEGIAKAKREGKRIGGRQRKITHEAVDRLLKDGLGASAIARELGCDRTAVYRAHPEGWGPSPIGG